MLFQLVNQTCARIAGLDLTASARAIATQIREHAPDTVGEVVRESNLPQTEQHFGTIAWGCGTLTITIVKAIPGIAGQISDRIHDRRIPSSRRFMLAGILAYLVQPHDFIHDDAPGGYGYLDDAIVMRAAVLEYLNQLPQGATDLDTERKMVGLLLGFAPSGTRPLIQQSIETMALGLQLMSMMDGDMAEALLHQLIANPLQTAAPASPPQRFSPWSVPNYQQETWRNGACFSGNNVMITGGPSLIDGQLFIPS